MDENKQYELMFKINQAQQHTKEIEEKIQVIDQQIVELQRFDIELSDLNGMNDGEILASLGKGVFIKSKLIPEKLFVDVGSGVLVRKSPEEAKKVLSEQLKKLTDIKLQLGLENERIGEEVKEIMKEMEVTRK